MEILNVSAECFPVAKVGGLADVVGALPKYQKKLGVSSKVVMPFYANSFAQGKRFDRVYKHHLKLGKLHFDFEVLVPKTPLDFPLYLIKIPGLLDRPEVYSYDDDTERFLAFQYWENNQNLQDNYLLKNLIRHNQNKLVQQNLVKIKNKRQTQTQKSFDFYDNEVLFLEQNYRHSLRQRLPIRWANLQDISDALDVSYILKKLKYACFIANREKAYNSKHDIALLKEVLAVIEAKNLCKNDAIHIYYICFLMLQLQSDEKAEALVVLLNEKSDILSETEAANLYGLVISFFNRKSMKQKKDYAQMLAIYLLMLEKGLLNDGKFLHYKYLNNLMTCALKAEKFELAEQLAASYKKQIEPTFANIFYHFNMGKSAFHQTFYDKASRHFERIESSIHLFGELDRRVYLLKIYFLTDNTTLFESRADSFRQFLRNNKSITKNKKMECLNFTNFIVRFYKIKDQRNKADKSKLERLKQKIEKTKGLGEAKWLFEEMGKVLI